MVFAATHIHHTYSDNSLIDGLYSIGAVARESLDDTTQKIKNFVASPGGQFIIGLGIGVCMHVVYAPLTEKIVHLFGISVMPHDPFNELDVVSKVILSPFICVLGPIMEEFQFRGGLQEVLKSKLNAFYLDLGFSDSAVNIAARVTSVFFTSVVFGLIHFGNAIVFWCNPVLFLPQVIAATFMGFILGFAKEFSGELYMPIGMHIGNNTLAMANNFISS